MNISMFTKFFGLFYYVLKYVIYILIWKNILKRFTRMITGNHEIQRNVYKHRSFFKLRKCIMNSQQLKALHKHFECSDENVFNEEQTEKVLSSINKIKKMNDLIFNKYFNEIIMNFNQLQLHKEKLKQYYREKFDPLNKEHFHMLMKVWENLKGNTNINLVDRKWLEIGFQGPDPSTDFRGAGVLGLRNLFHFISESENAEYVYKVATNNTTWYFFSASGINFTGKIIDLVESKKLDEILIHYKGDILLFVNKLYDVLFTNFNKFWVRKEIKDFMKFNTLLEEYMSKEAHKYFNHDLIRISSNKFY